MSTRSRRHRARSSQGEARPFAGRREITSQAAGVDIGAHEIVACVPDGEDHQIVRTFGTYTADLQTLADWLVDRGIQTVAMESPGVYWMPLFEELAARGLHCCLISAASIKRVPGRKSDVLACQWLQTLHSSGLLTASFRPEAALVALRPLLRHRAHLLAPRAPHGLHMQQALLQMNMQLSQALSDITGLTGQRIIRAIVAGERNPQQLASLAQFPLYKGGGRDRDGVAGHLARGASVRPSPSAGLVRLLHDPAQRMRCADRAGLLCHQAPFRDDMRGVRGPPLPPRHRVANPTPTVRMPLR